MSKEIILVEGAKTAKPWAQLPNESDRQYQNFMTFLKLGPTRTLQAAYSAVNGSQGKATDIGGFGKLSKRFSWVARSQAYDKSLTLEVIKVQEDSTKEWARRTSSAGNRATTILDESLSHISPESIKDNPMKVIAALGKFRVLDTIVAAFKALHGEKSEVTTISRKYVFKDPRSG